MEGPGGARPGNIVKPDGEDKTRSGRDPAPRERRAGAGTRKKVLVGRLDRAAGSAHQRRMRGVLRFLSNMDAQAWRMLLVSFLLFGGVGMVFLCGAQIMGFGGEATLERWLGAASGPWSLPAAVAAFAVLAFLGVPQFVLIAAAVVVFGPARGFAYSWVGTMVSALVGFRLGRLAGARALERFSGPALGRFMQRVGRNGFFASFIVRLAPSAPFILVNMAAGVTPMRLSHFLVGTGLGIVPKIALTAFAGASVGRLLNAPTAREALWLGLAAAAWVGLGWFARRWLRARDR